MICIEGQYSTNICEFQTKFYLWWAIPFNKIVVESTSQIDDDLMNLSVEAFREFKPVFDGNSHSILGPKFTVTIKQQFSLFWWFLKLRFCSDREILFVNCFVFGKKLKFNDSINLNLNNRLAVEHQVLWPWNPPTDDRSWFHNFLVLSSFT